MPVAERPFGVAVDAGDRLFGTYGDEGVRDALQNADLLLLRRLQTPLGCLRCVMSTSTMTTPSMTSSTVRYGDRRMM